MTFYFALSHLKKKKKKKKKYQTKTEGLDT